MSDAKYRLWDSLDNRMIYPEEATNGKEVLAIGLHGLPIAIDSDSFSDPAFNAGKDEIKAWNVDHRYIAMRCTGKSDKNGKLIYQGDIVLSEVEVIGNHYENPDMMDDLADLAENENTEVGIKPQAPTQ